MRPPGEPRLNLGGFVGGIVIHDDMDIEPFGDLSIDLFEELQELDRPVTLVAFADDKPRGDIECGKQRGGTMPHVSCVCDVRVRPASSARPAARDQVPESGFSHQC